MARLLSHYIKYLAIYFVFAQTFLLSSWSKWTSNGLPEFFVKQFEHSFLATIPGLTLSFYFLAAMESLVFLLVLVSVFTGDWRPDHARKDWLKLAIAAAALTFGALGFGQNLTNQYAGAAELFGYFGATLVAWLVVSADESAAARQAALQKATVNAS
jgi:hypothetical protein